jgi:hypothetical protein
MKFEYRKSYSTLHTRYIWGIFVLLFWVLLTSAPGTLFKYTIERNFLFKKLHTTIFNALTLQIPIKIL